MFAVLRLAASVCERKAVSMPGLGDTRSPEARGWTRRDRRRGAMELAGGVCVRLGRATNPRYHRVPSATIWHSTLFGTWHSGTLFGTWHSGTREVVAPGTLAPARCLLTLPSTAACRGRRRTAGRQAPGTAPGPPRSRRG